MDSNKGTQYYERMTYGEYVTEVTTGQHYTQRPGQYAYYVLQMHRPDIANQVLGTDLDPFHKDEVEVSFLEYVAQQWDYND
jgi:hypothetical protein